MPFQIRVEFINPFIIAVTKTFETMAQCKVIREAPMLKKDMTTLFPVSGIIGLSGRLAGTVVLTMSEELAIKGASAMLMTEMKAVDADVMDAVGELTNMIAGSAKAQLEEYNLKLSLPNVIYGRNTELRFPENSQPFTIPFRTEFGPMAVEVGFTSERTG
jgi:chemotaxis protein CheX